MEKLEAILSSKLLPMSQKLQRNKVLAALMEGFIRYQSDYVGDRLHYDRRELPNSWLDRLLNENRYFSTCRSHH